MLIPLWLPWTVLIAATLFAFLGQDSLPGPGRDPGRWAMAVIALIVTLSLSADRWQVKDNELYDAVSAVMKTVDGTTGQLTSDRLEILVEERIGREVEVAGIGQDEDEVDPTRTTFEVRVGKGAAACAEVQSQESASGPPIVFSLGSSPGACD